MNKKQVYLRNKILRLQRALRPFANVELPEDPLGKDIWLYVGKRDSKWDNPDLLLEDFERAKRTMS